MRRYIVPTGDEQARCARKAVASDSDDNEVVAAPGTGKVIVVTRFNFGAKDAGRMELHFGARATITDLLRVGSQYAEGVGENPGLNSGPIDPHVGPENTALNLSTDTCTKAEVSVAYYITKLS